jgi:hypothetical protein
MTALVLMSRRELDRAGVLARVTEGSLTQVQAAQQLGLSVRQVRRLLRVYVDEGPRGLASRQRGRPSNRRFPEGLREAALAVVRARYADFGPTLALEKLTELHGFELSVTTLRQWMVEDGLWTPRKLRDRQVHQPRRRRACRGELIQIDGCDHHWFEDRAPRCVLLVFVDDATGELMELRFARSESTFEYFSSVRRYLGQHGRPVALYSDKASIFRVNRKDHAGSGLTQFGRAMSDLNIDVICANSAPAKGRVERAHQTLQDRLVKELRLAGVSDMEAGNAFLPGFVEDYNRRFGRQAESPHDAHRPLLAHEPLDDIFQLQVERKVSGNLTLHYKRVMYVLEPTAEAHDVKGKLVSVFEDDDGNVSIRAGDIEFPARAFAKDARAGRRGVTPGDIVDNKLLGAVLTQIRGQQLTREKERLGANGASSPRG